MVVPGIDVGPVAGAGAGATDAEEKRYAAADAEEAEEDVDIMESLRIAGEPLVRIVIGGGVDPGFAELSLWVVGPGFLGSVRILGTIWMPEDAVEILDPEPSSRFMDGG
ncbi:hypothetical protein HDU67_000595 [Dinochytrium kinnereticum]|nr:hypothetical protein HDU67_000595 [Dinochytrium kinnereticum]